MLARAINGNETAVLLALCSVLMFLLKYQYGRKPLMANRQIPRKKATRKLGRGQYPQMMPIYTTITGAGSTATIDFDQPVVVSGTIPLVVTGKTLSSQTLVTSQQVTQLYSTTIGGAAFNLSDSPANVAGGKGQLVLGDSGTF